jgi:hypothetical protein
MYKPISGGKAMDENEKSAEGDDAHIEKVRRRAHAIWLDQGMVHGRDQEHWRQAEQEIAAEEAERATPKAIEPTLSSVEGAGESSVEDAGEAPVKDAGEAPVADAGESPAKYAVESSIKDAGESPVKDAGEPLVEDARASPIKYAGESPVKGTGESLAKGAEEPPVRGAA